MTQQVELLRKIDSLPPKYFGEVIDFVGYLQKKAQNEDNGDNKAMAAGTEREQKVREWCNPLLGLGKTIGASLTLDRFMELQQEEIELENKYDQML